MKKLFLVYFIYFPFIFSFAFCEQETLAPVIEVVTSSSSLMPSKPLLVKEIFPDFLKVRATAPSSEGSVIYVKLFTNLLEKSASLYFSHENDPDHIAFYLMDKSGNKVWKNGTLIQLERQEDLSFYKCFDLILTPQKTSKLISSGNYNCSFHVKLSEEL